MQRLLESRWGASLSVFLLGLCAVLALGCSPAPTSTEVTDASTASSSSVSTPQQSSSETNTAANSESVIEDFGPQCPPVSTEERQLCKAKGGELKKVGRLHCVSCVVSYSDGGKSCTGSSQCEGSCLAIDPVPVGQPGQVGVCEANDNKFGCKQEIAKDGTAFSGMLCID